MNKEKIYEIWQRKEIQIAIDICRILLVVIAAIILYQLIANINEVKILAGDPCAICMNRTGAVCWSNSITG